MAIIWNDKIPARSTTTAPLIEKKYLPGSTETGSFLMEKDQPEKLILTPRGYGGIKSQIGYERDHIIAVALGGTSDPDNIKIQQKKAADYKDNVEKYYIGQYKKGKISLNQARAKIVNWDNIEIPGQKAFNKDLYVTPLNIIKCIPGAAEEVGRRLLKLSSFYIWPLFGMKNQ